MQPTQAGACQDAGQGPGVEGTPCPLLGIIGSLKSSWALPSLTVARQGPSPHFADEDTEAQGHAARGWLSRTGERGDCERTGPSLLAQGEGSWPQHEPAKPGKPGVPCRPARPETLM